MIKANKHKIMLAVLLTAIGVMGFFADKYFIRYEIFGETHSNYEFTTDNENDVQLAYSVNFPLKTFTVDLNGLIRNLCGQREMNGAVKLDNNHIIIPEKKWTNEQIRYCAKQIIDFAGYCHEQGADFLYIQPPINIDENNKQLPVGIEDYRNENVDDVMALLKNSGIEILDLRETMREDGLDLYDYMYRTDHHWNTRAGFYCFLYITDYIEDKTGKAVDPIYTDINNYNINLYKGWHLGSTGQRVGRYFAGVDDYELITPKFETKLSNGDGNIYSFDEIGVNWDIFENKDATSRYTYDYAYNTGWKNTENTTDVSILLFSDSYASALSPFMDLAYSEYNVVYFPSGLSAEIVKNAQPEIVFFMPYIYNEKKLKYVPLTEQIVSQNE